MKKSIVHVITGLGNGGAEMMLYKLLSEMNKNLYDIKVISLLDFGIMGDKIEGLGIEVYALRINTLKGLLTSFYNAKKICKSVDVIQTWMYHADFFGFILAKIILNKKLIWGIRHGALERGKDKFTTITLAKINAYLSSYIDEIICCSNISRIFHEKLGYKKIKVIPNGFNIEQYKKDIPNRENLLSILNINNKKILLSIGRWNRSKNYPNLLRSLYELNKCRQDFICLLVGNNLADNEELYKLIDSFGIGDIVKVLGRRDDIVQILSISDVFISHSDIEGFSNVLGEAMLCEVFSVATDVGDNSYILGDNGFIVRPNDYIDLKNKIDESLNLDTELKKNYELMSRNRICDEFSIDTVCKLFCELY